MFIEVNACSASREYYDPRYFRKKTLNTKIIECVYPTLLQSPPGMTYKTAPKETDGMGLYWEVELTVINTSDTTYGYYVDEKYEDFIERLNTSKTKWHRGSGDYIFPEEEYEI